jgi:hypothetical protein
MLIQLNEVDILLEMQRKVIIPNVGLLFYRKADRRKNLFLLAKIMVDR